MGKKRGSHIVSWFVRKLIEHKRFRSALASFVILAHLSASSLSTASAFTASDFQTPLVTEEVVLTTKRTSRLPVFGTLSQGFTYYHPAIDIEHGLNEPVYPILPGFVVETGFQSGGYGNYVLIDHKNGYFSLYAHLNKVLVAKGHEASSETPIGTVGTTGYATGAHLHLEVFENGVAVNPLSILPTLPDLSGNVVAFGGGLSVHPARTLLLPISQSPIVENVTYGKEVKRERAKLSLSISQQDLPASARPR